MDGREGSKVKLERHGRLGRGVWMRYLIAGATLAATRVAFLVWINNRRAWGTATQWEYDLADWLYPEAVVSIFWNSLVSSYDGATSYIWRDLAWGSLIAIGSFVLATPILFVRWLRQRNLIVQIALCGLTIPAVIALLLVIVRLFGLIE